MAFSRKFEPTDSLCTANNNEVYQATFIKEKVSYFLSVQWPGADRIRIESTTVNSDPTWRIRATDGLNSGTLDADFPCPKQCLPPLIEKDLTGIKVEFDVHHIMTMLARSGCVLLNFQLAKRSGLNTDPADSCAVYPLTVEMGQLVAKNNKNADLFFISDPT